MHPGMHPGSWQAGMHPGMHPGSWQAGQSHWVGGHGWTWAGLGLDLGSKSKSKKTPADAAMGEVSFLRRGHGTSDLTACACRARVVRVSCVRNFPATSKGCRYDQIRRRYDVEVAGKLQVVEAVVEAVGGQVP